MRDTLVERGQIAVGEMRWVVAPERTFPKTIEIPSEVVIDLVNGLDKLAARVEVEKPEALVLILRKAGLLEKAIEKKLPAVPLVGVCIGRKFPGGYKNLKMAEGYFFEADVEGRAIIGEEYVPWLKIDPEAIEVAEKLRAKVLEEEIVHPKKIMGVDDSSSEEIVSRYTWPTIAKMAFGEETQIPFATILGREWLSEIIEHNFHELSDSYNGCFLREVATGRLWGCEQKIEDELDLMQVESFLRNSWPEFKEARPEDIAITPTNAEFLITLSNKIEEALAAVV